MEGELVTIRRVTIEGEWQTTDWMRRQSASDSALDAGAGVSVGG